jgi:arsenite methyltransferase
VEFRRGLAKELPVADCWADVVISNGVINLCADKHAVFAEIFLVLRPGGRLQFADIANGQPVPVAAPRHQSVDRLNSWRPAPVRAGTKCCRTVGFTEVVIGEPVDTFGGALGEPNARAFEVYGYAFMACRPA